MFISSILNFAYQMLKLVVFKYLGQLFYSVILTLGLYWQGGMQENVKNS